jgi:hypothetical protein
MSVELRGRVVERGIGAGLPGLRVQAWNEARDEAAGEAGTGDGGEFTLRVGGDEEGTVVLSFRVWRGDALVLSSEGSVIWSSKRPDEEVLLEVDPPREPVTELPGRLIGGDGAPLPGLLVELRVTDEDGTAAPIGVFLCDQAGAFVVRLGPDGELSALVRAADGALLGDAQVRRRRRELVVRSPLVAGERHEVPLTEALEALGIPLPTDYLDRLAAAGVRTFDEFGRAPDEVVEPEGAPDGVPALRLAAGMRTLTGDLGLIRALTAAGYPTLTALADAPGAELTERMAPTLDPAAAARLQANAQSQHAYLGTLAAGARAANTRPASSRLSVMTDVLADTASDAGDCDCSDCRSAVSPAAYLADLLAYAVAHVRRAGQQLDLGDIIDLTQQPLRTLPLDCDSVDAPITRLRIVVEVLRAHLARQWATVPQERRDALAAAERRYLSTAYLRLLAEHGTSYQELRAVRVATPAERSALAERLGIDLDAPDPLADLLLDPNATAPQLTEAALQRLFGYQTTTGDPLADVPAGLLSDRRRAYQRSSWLRADHPADPWSFEREQQQSPSIDPDLVGPGDFRDQNPVGNPCLILYNARRAWVDTRSEELRVELETNGVPATLTLVFGPHEPDWDGLAAELTGSAADAEAARAAIAGLGLTMPAFDRLMAIRAAAAAPAPADPPSAADLAELAAILTQSEKVRAYPTWVQEEENRNVRLNLQRFRLIDIGRVAETPWLGPRAGRVAWQEALRRRSAAPVVDPVLLGPVDFRNPLPSGAVYQLWDGRRQFVQARIAQVGSATPTLARLDDRVRTVLDDISPQAWQSLRDRHAAGSPLSEELVAFTIRRAELDDLIRLRTVLAGGQPVADPEWQDAALILTRVVLRRQIPRWRSEERQAGLVIGPDDFALAGLGDVTPPPRLGAVADRAAWQDTLRARIEQADATRLAAEAAIRAAEQEALPILRDALVAASEIPLTAPAERADWLGDRLLIDVLAGPTDVTTRIAQAIESLQVLLFSLRTAQLTDTHPDLDLFADHFDEEWDWIGSYGTWRAAMFVFLYPENLLLPSLRRHQTYGFRTLVTALRTSRRATPVGVLAEVKAYLRYLDDVSRLRIGAVALAAGGSNPVREHSYLFAMPDTGGGRVYWSRDDPKGTPGRTQSSWAPVNSLTNVEVTQIIGAAASHGFGPDRLYLFVKTFDDGSWKLGVTTLDPEEAGSLIQAQDGGWSDLQELDLPDDPGDFTAALVQDLAPDWPELALSVRGGRFYLRRVADADWEEGDWQPIPLNRSELPPQTEIHAVLSVVRMNVVANGYLVFVRYRSGAVWVLYIATFQGLRSTMFVAADVRRWQGALLMDDPSQPENPNQPRAGTARAYAFWFDGAVTWYQSFGVSVLDLFSIVKSSNSFLDGEGRLAVSGGNTSPIEASGSRITVAYQRGGPPQGVGWNEPGLYLTSVSRLGTDSVLVAGTRQPIAPRLNAASVVQIGEYQRDPQRRHLIQTSVLPSLRGWWDRGANAIGSNRDYLQEAYGFVPLHAALTLQQRREYVAALDWFRVVYDYAAPAGERTIYLGLVDELSLEADFERATDWLLDTMNPHAVAETRRGSYTRFTVLAMVRCLVEYANDLFTSDTAEAIARARTLYGTALDLLDSDELRQDDGACEDLIGAVDVTVGGPEWVPILQTWARSLLALSGRTAISNAVSAMNAELRADAPWAERVEGTRAVLDQALGEVRTITAPESIETQARQVQLAQRALMRSTDVESVLLRIGGATVLPIEAIPLKISGYWAPAPHFAFCVVPNPTPRTLRLWAELNLFKIHTGRNIAGLERPIEAYSAPTDTSSGLPTIGAGGQLSVPGARSYRPTPYRYPLLIARARELADLAGQVEASMLAAIQAGDQERYTRLKARQDLSISRAGVRLQNLRTTEAKSEARVAELSKQRATLSVSHYTELLEEGPSATEQAALLALGAAVFFQQAAAVSSVVAASIQGSYAAGLSAVPVTAATAPPVWASMWSSIASASSSQAAAVQTLSSLLSMQAGFERRIQEWDYQRSLASLDVVVADQQIQVAEDRIRVVAQEREIAQLNTDNAEQTIDFLDNKFTNIELYDFMADELERVYAFVLEQAAATARLAADQLAFERQEDPPAYIRADYWQPSSDSPLAAEDEESNTDRRGLTGSARLLGDIVQLDGYAFETDRRKLHLTTTLSLAQLAPVEFARFRQTGQLTFDTSSEWFDRQFPGHYLRLIRRVRLSVIALIPPTNGIRATLAQSGPSYVMIGGPPFSRVKLRGGTFDEVALSSPFSDTGVFELDPQPQLRFPFEGSGLDTRWTLRLPRAANPFDFQTLGDVLMTVEYTALNDTDLRSQVIAAMRPTQELTLPLSLRTRYPDQWYQLHNRQDRTPPFEVSLEVPRSFLPPHLEGVQLSHVALLLAHDAGTLPQPITVELLGRRTPNGVTGSGAMVSVSGLASSRTSAQGWNTLPRDPVGDWVLRFRDDPETRQLFDSGQLNDVLLALTLTGRTPSWI